MLINLYTCLVYGDIFRLKSVLIFQCFNLVRKIWQTKILSLLVCFVKKEKFSFNRTGQTEGGTLDELFTSRMGEKYFL